MADPALLAHLGAEGVVERDGAWVYRFDPASNAGRQPVDAWTLLDRITAPTLIARGGLSPFCHATWRTSYARRSGARPW
jgi:hypothetical protein